MEFSYRIFEKTITDCFSNSIENDPLAFLQLHDFSVAGREPLLYGIVDLVKNGGSPRSANRSSHRLPSEAVDLILSMTARGASNAMIRESIRETFKTDVHPNLVNYYRRTRATSLAELCEEELLDVRVSCDLGSLAQRLGVLDKVINNEFAKKSGGSALVIARAVTLANQIVYRAEMMRIRLMELKMKERSNSWDSEAHERILRELERCSHMSQSEEKPLR